MSLLSKITSFPGFNSTQKSQLRKVHAETPKFVYRTTDATVNVSTTLANDSELYFDLLASKKYFVEMNLFTLADATDGIKVTIATATDVTSGRVLYTYGYDNASQQTETQTDFTSPAPIGAAGAATSVTARGFIQPAVDGRYTLQTALFADNNAPTTIYKGSYIKIYELVE